MPRITAPTPGRFDNLLFFLIFVTLLVLAVRMIRGEAPVPSPAPSKDVINYYVNPAPQNPGVIVVAPAVEYRLPALSGLTPSEREQYFLDLYLRNPAPVYPAYLLPRRW